MLSVIVGGRGLFCVIHGVVESINDNPDQEIAASEFRTIVSRMVSSRAGMLDATWEGCAPG